jgi:hypothetical protein
MNLDVFRSDNKTGKFSREKWVMENYNKEWSHIVKFAEDFDLTHISFVEKVYLCLNSLTALPTCSNDLCSKHVKFLSLGRGYAKYCSNKCVSSDSALKLEKEKNALAKWGTTHPQKNPSVKEKTLQTNLDKYGHKSPMLNKTVQKKATDTLVKNFGVTNPSKSLEIIEKRIETFRKSSFKETFTNTSFLKYGTNHPWSNKEVHDKSILSSKIKKRNNTELKIKKKLEEYPLYKFKSIDFDNRIINISCPLGHDFEIARHTFDERYNYKTEICTICKPVWSGISGLELQLTNFLLDYNIEIEIKKRDIISPLELDVFIPSKNVAIEFNGLYWHSSAHKNKDYHKKKWQLCSDLGIKIINVWEDDWIYKQNIVKSNILYSLGLLENKIAARKCEIREVTSKQSWSFLEENHLQGGCRSSCRIGLFFNDELVSLMTFSKPRLPLSGKNYDEGTWELTRFCNKANIIVQGAASRLLSYFERNYSPKQIETYSDNSTFDGAIYQLLGFKFIHFTKPGYWYLVNGKRDYRFNWRKFKLVSMGADPNKTEEQIMSEWGYPRVYNAGNKKWVKYFS